MNHSQATYQQCSRCVMDTSDPDIQFDTTGVCNHCHSYDRLAARTLLTGQAGKQKIQELVEEIKTYGKDAQYDCILGVSGGVDSSYLAYLAHQWGLRPLVIHLDNGWNSEIAVQNINNIIEKTGFDLYTHVINWEEFRDLQLAFLKASVIDLELTSDHAIFSLIYDLAMKYKVKYLLSGFNVVTEGILPRAWRWNKMDWLNIKDIHRQYGEGKLRTFPHISFVRKWYYDQVLKLKSVQPLNYLDYNKGKVKTIIADYFGWKDYGGKHYESIITRFYQGYILPTKFKVDKRKAHLSTLIGSGQITKEEALQELDKPSYDHQQQAIDMEFVQKKFGLSEDEFAQIMEASVRGHEEFATYETQHYRYQERFFETIRPATRLVKSVLKPQPQTA